MKLWILRPVDDEASPWTPWYDRAFGFIVRAETEAVARQIASFKAGNEKPAAWLDESLSSCEELTADGEPGLILRDFSAA